MAPSLQRLALPLGARQRPEAVIRWTEAVGFKYKSSD